MGVVGIGMILPICTNAWDYIRIIMSDGARSDSLSSHRKAVGGKTSRTV
jgi:hypothetical protein